MVRGGKLCREDGQSTVEYALVVVAFLSILLALGVVWHSGRQGALLERAIDASSHQVGGSDVHGALRDVVLF